MVRPRCLWSLSRLTATRRFLLLAFLLPLVCRSANAAPPEPAPAAWDLAQCLDAARHKQPALNAERASVAVAEQLSACLDALHVPTCIVRELPFRRQQAALGVTVAHAGVDHAGAETVYAVTRSYFSVVYARQQEGVGRTVAGRISDVKDIAKRMLDAGAREVTTNDVDRTSIYLELAEARRIQATKGIERALAALREAIGLEPCCPLQVADPKLPEPTIRPNRDEIVCWAVARRGELAQARLFIELTSLEIEAQGTSLHAQLDTFASASDIHSRQVPDTVREPEYRPGAVPPEMPTHLVGPRECRVAIAQSLHDRAVAVALKARNLIALEAENAYLQWEEASEQAARAKRAADTGDRLAESLNKDLAAGQKVRLEDVLNAQVLAGMARSQYNEYLYRQILALAELERVTAGAFCAGLAAPPLPAK